MFGGLKVADRPETDADLDVMLSELETFPVGPALAAHLAGLPPEDWPCWADPHLRVRVTALWTRVGTWTEAQAMRQLAAGATATAVVDQPVLGVEFGDDLALSTRVSSAAADRRIALAVTVSERMPAMRTALDDAELTVSHARALARILDPVELELARRVEAAVVERAVRHRWTPSRLATAARLMLERLDPDGGAARHDRALDIEAGVADGPMAHALAWLSAVGDAVTVADITTAVDQRAEQLKALAPDTPVGRVRFAALGDLVLRDRYTLFDHVMGVDTATVDTATVDATDTGDDADLSTSPARPTRAIGAGPGREVIVTIDLPTLLSLRDDPAQLAEYGPIPARLARLLAADATLRRLITDPVTGDTLDLGLRSYAPSRPLARYIRARDQTCVFPHCTRVRRTQIDHRHPRSQRGPTNRDNLQVLCQRHHALKTAGLWDCVRNPDGTTTWTGPAGQRSTTPRSRNRDEEPDDQDIGPPRAR